MKQHTENNLPEGWIEINLDQILQVLESGSRPKGGVRGIKEGVPSIGGEHINDKGGFRFDTIKFVTHNFFERMNRGRIQIGDVLIVKDGATTGKVAMVREDFPYNPAAVNEHVFICRPEKGVHPPFLFYFLFSKEGQDRILENFRGSAQGGINQSFAPGTIVPIAPPAKQKRIVTKVEEMFARVNTTKERLAKVTSILKRFRQAVLFAACSGRLTADWREDNPSPMNYSEEELPLGWRTALVGEVIQSLKYGTSQKCSYEKRGVPVLRIPNIDQGVIDNSDLKYAELRDKEFRQLYLRTGDILMIRSNGSVSLVGKSAIVYETEEGFAYAGYLIRIRPDLSKIIPEFLNLVLGSHDIRIQIEVPARSTSGVHNINSEEVRALQFSLPPVREQQEIVRRVEAMFKLAEAVEKRVVAARVRAEKLTQAILAKAFRGELVPTEAELARREGRTYESASDLLARIKAETHSKVISGKPSRNKVRQKVIVNGN